MPTSCGTPARPRAHSSIGLSNERRRNPLGAGTPAPPVLIRLRALGKGGRDVPPASSGTRPPALPHVVLGRRAVRTGRHRLRDQQRRPRWTKRAGNPMFSANPETPWERYKVTACQVLRHGGWHYMFYIGFRDYRPCADRTGPLARRPHRVAAPPRQSHHSPRLQPVGP